MEQLRLQVFRNNPELASDQIADLLSDYSRFESSRVFRRKQNTELDSSLLEEILPYVLTDTFFDYIYNHCKFKFRLKRYFPQKLKSNQQFIDLVIKYDPMNAFLIPDADMITLAHLKYVENYLLSNPDCVLDVKSLPEAFKDSKIVFERVLKYYFDGKPKFSEINLFDILEIYYDKPEFYSIIFDRFNKGNYYIKNVYDFSSRKCLDNDEILKLILECDIDCLLIIPEEYMERVSLHVATLIKHGDEDVVYFFKNLRPVPDNIKKLVKNKIIVDAIFKSPDIGPYRLLFEEMNIDQLKEKHFRTFFYYIEEERSNIRPRNFFSSPKLLSVVLNDIDYIYGDLSIFKYFDVSAYDDANIIYIVTHLNKIGANMRMYFFERLYFNDVFMTQLLVYLKQDLTNNWDFMKYFKYRDMFNRTNVDTSKVSPVIYEIIDLLADYNILKYDTFSNKWWKNKDFIKKIEEEKCLKSIIKDMFRSFRGLINGYHDSHPMYENSAVFYAYIEECINYILANDNSIIRESFKYIRYFNIDYSADSRLFKFIDVLISKELFNGCQFSPKFWKSSDVYIYFIENNYGKYCDKFDISAMEQDARVINYLFRNSKYFYFLRQFTLNDNLNILPSKIEINSIDEYKFLFNKLK